MVQQTMLTHGSTPGIEYRWLHCLRRQDLDKGPGSDRQVEPTRDTEAEERQSLRCRECGHEITTREDAVEVDGKHEHTFFNPAGILFRIGCFESAPGCENVGIPTDEFSWFPGLSWRFSLCGECQSHLGWLFVAGEGPSFWGLILDRLEAG